MPNTPASASNDAWGTLAWFSYQFSSGSANDPTAYFSHAVNGYQVFRHTQLCRWLRGAVRDAEPRSLADVGCGNGVLTAKLAAELGTPRAVGLDFLADAVRDAKRHYPEIEFATGELPQIELSDSGFDVVVASEVLYYLSPEDRERAVAEIDRVLRPDGVLLFASRLGGRYFGVDAAERLLSSKLRVEARHFFFNRLYEQLMRPLRGLRRASEIAHGDTDPTRPGLTRMIRRLGFLLTNPVARLLLGVIAVVERACLRSALLPGMCHAICRAVAPRWTRTGVVLIARKGAR